MDASTFLRNAERGPLPPVVLVHGGDAQLLDDVLAVVTRGLFPDAAAAAFDREVFDGREADTEAVVNAALTLPLGAPRRLVVVRHAQGLPARDAGTLARYAAAPSPAACLLLLADEALGPGRDRKAPHWLLEAVPATAVVEPVARRGRAVEDWVRQRARGEGLTVSEEAARLLVQWVGDDGAALLGEVRKAALAGGPDNRSVGVTEVTAVVGEHRVSGVFDLTRAIERREPGLALRTLERLLATEDPMPVLALLTREVRTAWTVREWHAGGLSVEQIARRLNRPPAVVQALVAAATAQSPAALTRKLERCWETERRLKSRGDPLAEMATLVTELCRGA
jgi:DNA polymerase-3 subunit delta